MFAPAPPPPRASQYLFLSGDTCSVAVAVSPTEPPLEFDLPCSMVRPTDDNEFEPLPDALCKVAVPEADGGSRFEWLRCTQIATELKARATEPVGDTDESLPPDGSDDSGEDSTEEDQT